MRRTLGILLITAAVLQFGFRGVQRIRSEIPLWDFASVYAAARAWEQGGNPYDREQVVRTWRETGVFQDRDASYFATVYPPSSLLLLAPFGPLPALVAMAAWLAITIALLTIQFMMLGDLAKIRWNDPRFLILVGGSLASAPYQFGILSGQLSMPAISGCIAAIWLVSRDRQVAAGIVLGLACALKPQVGGPIFIYYLMLRHRNLSIVTILCGGLIAIASVAAMHVAHIEWLDGWKSSIAATQVTGAVNDYSWAGYFRDEIIDLKILLVSFIHKPRLLQITIDGAVLTLLAWYVAAFRRQHLSLAGRDSLAQLLVLGALSGIALLPIYHRIYDVALLTMAFAWALGELNGPRRNTAKILMLPMLIFLIPFDGVRAVSRRATFLSNMSNTNLWRSIVEPHYAWGLLATTIGLLMIMSRFRRQLPVELQKQ